MLQPSDVIAGASLSGRAETAGHEARGPRPGDSQSFGQALARALDEVRALGQEVENAALEAATWSTSSFHEIVLDLERAKLTIELMAAIRNRALEAYREITNIQV